MKWLIQNAVSEVVAPAARRVGGNLAALLVGLGMAGQHESAVAAAIAWAIVSAVELMLSAKARTKLKAQWGKN